MSHAFFDFIENTISPIAARAGNQRHIVAVRDGFIGAMPFMIVGSFLLVFAYPPFSADTTFAFGQWWLGMAKTYAHEIITPFNMSMGIMACYISAGIAYQLSQSYKLDAFPTSMLTLMTFLLIAAPMKDGMMPSAFLGGAGIFTAIIVAIYTTELVRFLKAHNIGIKLPEQVPEKIRQSFNLLIPALLIILTIYPVNMVIHHELGMYLPEAIMAIFKPLISAADSLPAILLAVFLCPILWFAGIHGAAIVTGILQPFWLVNLGLNQAALAAGQPLPHVFIESFWQYFVTIGGSGATIGLVLLYMRSKSAHLRSIGKLGIVPACFNINEPVIFGSPIVMNPVLFFPFVVCPMLNATIAYVCATTGLVGKVISLVPWTAPAPIGAAWAAGWQFSNGLLVLGLIVLDLLVYLPFFKVYEKQLLAQETETLGTEDETLAVAQK
jgi:PTS system cellobiose-specific IIC component